MSVKLDKHVDTSHADPESWIKRASHDELTERLVMAAKLDLGWHMSAISTELRYRYNFDRMMAVHLSNSLIELHNQRVAAYHIAQSELV